MKIDKRKINLMLLFTLLVMLLTSFISTAQTDSLIWENCPGGVYLNDWVENSPDEWEPYNDSGIGVVNFTGNVWGYILNNTTVGHRWYQTFEVNADSAETGVMSIMSSSVAVDNNNFYAMIYFLSDPVTASPSLYMMRMVAGTPWYYNGTDYETNISNATCYSQDEIDYFSGFCRVKALWNFYDETDDFTARFKIWDPAGDEPDTWMIDDSFARYEVGVINSNMWYSAIGAENTFCGEELIQFRRIAMWNLSYDLYDDTVAYIGVPQYDALTFLEDMDEYHDIDDIWNYTNVFVDMINQWDLTSFYNLNDISKNGAQNDTIYIFSIITTGWEDVFDEYWGEDWWDEWGDAVFPNNILVLHVFNPTDGTPGEDDAIEWDDFCRLRFDFDNDGYDASDYTFEVDGTDTLFGYHGWTQVIPDSPVEWYGEGYFDYIDDDSWGHIFRDYEYPNYVFFLNWDLISGGIDVNTPVNISISFLDNESDDYSIWQDWDETDDITPNAESDNETWQSENTTTLWGIIEILGDSLDFEDPEESGIDYSDSPGLEPVMNMLPVLASAVFFAVLVLMMWSQTLTVETLVAWMIAFIAAVLGIVIMTGLI